MSQIQYNREQNPWFSFKPYEEGDATKFKGRGTDITEMMRFINDKDVTVCYAKSGIGKSSLINAGLMPRMRRRQLLPIPIRFTEDFFLGNLEEKIREQIFAEIGRRNAAAEKGEKDEEYRISRHPSVEDNPLMMLVDRELTNISTWWWLNTYNIICKRGEFEITYRPVLIFDQFEELFQKTKTDEQREAFFKWLQNMSLTRPSDIIQKKLDVLQKEHPDINIAIPRDCGWKILIALREDYVGSLDYWCAQRIRIPAIQDNRYCLMPLSVEQAEEVVMQQTIDGQRVDVLDKYKNVIIESLKEPDGIPAVLLSVLCNRIFDEEISGLTKTAHQLKSIASNSVTVENDTLKKTIRALIRSVYDKRIKESKVSKRTVRRIEEALVRDNGTRRRPVLADLSKKQQEACEKLSNVYLVHIDDFGKKNDQKEQYVEIIHDRVAEVVADKRHEISHKTRVLWSRIALVIGFILLFGFTYWNQFWTTSEYKANLFPYMEYREGESIWNILFGVEYKKNATHFGGKVNSQRNLTTLVCDTSNVEVSNCPVLNTIKVSSDLRDTLLNLSISNCRNLEHIEIGDNITNLTLSIADCPLVQYVNLPQEIDKLKLTVNTPNNINFPLTGNTRYFWQDGILWDKHQEQILYARSDAPEVVNPPFTARRSDYSIDRKFRVNNDTIRIMCKVGSDSTTINIPRTSDTLKIVSHDNDWRRIISIKDKDLTGIKVINFLSSEIVIMENVFANSPDLEIIDFSACKYVYLYDDAFANCHRLKKIIFPDTADICNNAFRGCSSIQYVRLPNNGDLSNGIFYCYVDTFDIDTTKSVFKREEDGTITNKDGIPLFADNVRYHTFENDTYYSKNGFLYMRDSKGKEGIYNTPFEIVKSLKDEMIMRNGLAYFNNCNNASEYVLFPEHARYNGDSIIVLLPFATKPTNLQKLHIQCSNFSEQNGVDASRLLASIPAEIRQQTTLYVPYNCRWYFENNRDFKGFKEIKEETWYEWAWSIIKHHYAIGMSFVSNLQKLWAMNLWAIIVFLLIIVSTAIAYVMYIIDKRKYGKPSKEAILKIIFKSFATVMLAVPVWYVAYWFFFLTVFPLFLPEHLVSNVCTLLSIILAVLVAIMVIYIVLFSEGFSLKGMWTSTESNLKILWQIVKGNPKKCAKIFTALLLIFALLAIYWQYNNFRAERLMKATTEVEKAIDDAEKRPNIALDILHKAWKDNFSIIEGEPVEDKLFSAIYSNMVSNGTIEGIDTLVQSNFSIDDIHVLSNENLVLSGWNGVYLYKDTTGIQLYDKHLNKIRVNDKGTCLALNEYMDKVVIIDLQTQEKDTIDCNTGVYGWHPTQPVLAYYDSRTIRFYDFKARENDKNIFITLDEDVKDMCYNKEGNEIAIHYSHYIDSISFYRLHNGNWSKASESIRGKNPSYIKGDYFSTVYFDSLFVWPVSKIGEDNSRRSWKVGYSCDYTFSKDGKIALARNNKEVKVLDLTSSDKEYLNLKIKNNVVSLSEDGKSIYLSYGRKLVKIPILTHGQIYDLLKSHYNDN